MSENRIDRIIHVTEEWLQPDNRALAEAIEQTVDGGYFSLSDIKHQVLSLKKALKADALRAWARKNQLDPARVAAMRGRSALCLHAGNLPLVGVQDLLACLMTGVDYTGKISRKDPWLLPSLLQLAEGEFHNESLKWSVEIEDLAGAGADYVLFSGSSRSVKKVRERIRQLQLASASAEYLVRTAHYSLAYIDNRKPKTMEDLTEAVFRYGGKGCRSVAVVISPFDYETVKCSFTDYIESFWLQNPQHEKPAPSLFYRYAYNKAIEISQSWLDDFLIEETTITPDQEFVLHWVRGDEQTAAGFAEKYGSGLQTVYVTEEKIELPGLKMKTEPLSEAQSPPVDWQPDGIDSISWLLRSI